MHSKNCSDLRFILCSCHNPVCVAKKSILVHTYSHSGHWLFLWVSSHFLITSESPADFLNLANKREKRMSCIADKVFEVWALKECFSLYLYSIGTHLPRHSSWRKKLRNVGWLCDQEEKETHFGAMWHYLHNILQFHWDQLHIVSKLRNVTFYFILSTETKIKFSIVGYIIYWISAHIKCHVFCYLGWKWFFSSLILWLWLWNLVKIFSMVLQTVRKLRIHFSLSL